MPVFAFWDGVSIVVVFCVVEHYLLLPNVHTWNWKYLQQEKVAKESFGVPSDTRGWMVVTFPIWALSVALTNGL